MQPDDNSRKSFRFTVITLLALIVLALCAGVIILLFVNKNNLTGQQGTPAVTETPAVSVNPTVTPTVTAVTPSVTPTVVPTGTALQIYFGKPSAEDDYNTLVSVPRYTSATGSDQFPFIISQIMAGPTADEKATGITGILTLSGTSTCSGSSFQYSRSGSTLTLKFCKFINYVQNAGSGGAYAGLSLAAFDRVYNALSQSLMINGVTTLVVKQSDNTCFAKDGGVNTACVD
jgi:hypothetical protein